MQMNAIRHVRAINQERERERETISMIEVMNGTSIRVVRLIDWP